VNNVRIAPWHIILGSGQDRFGRPRLYSTGIITIQGGTEGFRAVMRGYHAQYNQTEQPELPKNLFSSGSDFVAKPARASMMYEARNHLCDHT
jgi:hypothetical protein